MNKPTMDTLVRRLERVERENHTWRWVGSVVLVGMAALVLMGQATPTKVAKVVEAEKFVLRDSSGKIRAGLSVGSDGKVGLAFADKDGKIRAGLGITSDGSPGLALADKDGTRRAGLAIGVDGTVRLDLADKDGKPRAELAVLDYGSPVLFLRNNDGTPRALFGFIADRSPTITLTDKEGKPRAELAVSDDGLPHLAILDKDEKSSAWLTVSDDGSPALTLTDKTGNTRTLQVAVLSRELEQGRKELERVRKEKLRAEAEAKGANRGVAQLKLQLASVSKQLAEMQKQVDGLQQELSATQQTLKQVREQTALRRAKADRDRKDAAGTQRRVDELSKTLEERDYLRLVNEALAYTYRKGPGDEERAEAAYRKAVQIAQAKNIRDPVIYSAYAVFLQEQKRFEDAEKFYKTALEVNPSYGKALYNLGTLYESRGDLKQALEKYKAADKAGVKQARENYLRLRSILKQ
ncbi:MAG: tetratricopeptide repeat protein [Nitrospirales bacterium]